MSWDEDDEGYYDFFNAKSDPAQRVGWRSLVSQMYRHLLVAEYIGPEESLVDIGYGTGAFPALLRELEYRGRYVGVDPYPHLEQFKHLSNASFLSIDVRDLDDKCDVAVAIGTLVSNDESHRIKTWQLLDELNRVSDKAFVLVALDSEVMAALSWTDPALHGTTKDVVRAWASDRKVSVEFDDGLAPREITAVFGRELRASDQRARLRRAHKLAPRATPSERARLAHDLELYDEVVCIAEAHPDDEHVRMLVEYS